MLVYYRNMYIYIYGRLKTIKSRKLYISHEIREKTNKYFLGPKWGVYAPGPYPPVRCILQWLTSVNTQDTSFIIAHTHEQRGGGLGGE